MTELIVISCFACGRMYFSQYLEQLKFFNKPIQVLKKKNAYTKNSLNDAPTKQQQKPFLTVCHWILLKRVAK